MTDISIVGPVTIDRNRTGRHEWTGPGGVAYYGALAALQMGCSVAISTVLSQDDDLLLRELREAGAVVRVSRSNATTSFINTNLLPDGKRSQELIASARPIQPSDLTKRDSRLWYFGPLSPTDIDPTCFEAVKARRGRLALDGQGLLRRLEGHRVSLAYNAKLGPILSNVEILKLTDQEVRVATGTQSLRQAMEELSACGPREVIATKGSTGSCILANGRILEIPSYPVRHVVDTTGCGDTYFAVYLCARLESKDPELAGRLAAAASGVKATRQGGLAAGRDEIEHLAKGL